MADDFPPAADLRSLPGPRGLPLVGMGHRWEPGRSHLLLEQWAREHGPIYRLRLGLQTIVVISDADANATVLRDRPQGFRRHGGLRPLLHDVGLDGLLAAEDDDWRRQRPQVARALDPTHLRRYFPVVVTATERLHARWVAAATTKSPIDPGIELRRFSTDVTCSLVLGTDVATLLRDEPDTLQKHLARLIAESGRRLDSLWIGPHWWRPRMDRDLKRSLLFVHRVLRRCIEQARVQVAAHPMLATSPENLLQAMLADREAARVSDDELIGNLLSLLAAGEESTAATIAWAMHLLSLDPQARTAARTEALEALESEAEQEAPVSLEPRIALQRFDGTRALPLIEAVVLEALRLKPVAPPVLYAALRATVLCGVRIPERAVICLLSRPTAVDPRFFPRAGEFHPERWLGGQAAASGAGSLPTGAAPRRGFAPFGGGPRSCPGRFLALLQAKMALAMTLASFDLEPTGTPVDERMGRVMQPRGLALLLKPQSINPARARTRHR